ncbi:hypothetical protein M758_12G063900 [Ceratodon purpureus]|nr:hypothetical protein M758_12G063900 [Ceratodon purpureus]
MSRCYPFPPPGYEKAPQPDVAQPHKDKKDRHKDKHKDKKKKKKKDGETNGDAHDKDSSRPSKQPRTVSVNDLLQSKDEKQNGKVRDVLPTAVPLAPSTSAAEPSLVIKGEVRDGGKALARGMSQRTLVIPPSVIPSSQPLYSKQEPNGKATDVKPVVSKAGVKSDAKLPVVLVLPAESSGNELPSASKPGSISSIQPTLPSNNNLDSQRQSPKASELVASPPCEMLALKQTSTWSDVPDEDWLFAGRPALGLSHPKPKAEVERGAGGAGSVQVWAEAVFLPSCELYALPYVVPY